MTSYANCLLTLVFWTLKGLCYSNQYSSGTGYSSGSQSDRNNYQNSNNYQNNYQQNNYYQNYSGNTYSYGSSKFDFRVGFSSSAESCPNFNNQNFNAENVLLTPLTDEDEEGPELMCMEGTLDLFLVVVPGMQITVNIDKFTDTGSDPMYTLSLDVCEAIKNEDALWTPLTKALGIESCPVQMGTYDVNKLMLDLSFADGMLNHNNVGEYLVKVQMKDQQKMEPISCHTLGLCVVEV